MAGIGWTSTSKKTRTSHIIVYHFSLPGKENMSTRGFSLSLPVLLKKKRRDSSTGTTIVASIWQPDWTYVYPLLFSLYFDVVSDWSCIFKGIYCFRSAFENFFQVKIAAVVFFKIVS